MKERKKNLIMDLKAIKITVLAVLTCVFSFLSFYFLNKEVLLNAEGGAWPAVICFFVFIVFTVLNTVFIKDSRLVTALVFVQSAIFIPVFIGSLKNWNVLLISFVLLFIFTIWGVKRAHSRMKDSMRINFFSVAHRIVPKMITGILLLVIVLFYFNYVTLGKFDEDMGRRLFDKTADFLEPVLQTWVPEASLNTKVEDFLKEAAETQLERSKIALLGDGINLDELSTLQREQLINKTAEELEGKIEEITGELKFDQTVREFVYGIIKERIDAIPPAVKKPLAGFNLAIIFFVAKGISFIFYPVIEFIAFIIYQILMITGFAYIGLETKEREIINLS